MNPTSDISTFHQNNENSQAASQNRQKYHQLEWNIAEVATYKNLWKTLVLTDFFAKKSQILAGFNFLVQQKVLLTQKFRNYVKLLIHKKHH